MIQSGPLNAGRPLVLQKVTSYNSLTGSLKVFVKDDDSTMLLEWEGFIDNVEYKTILNECLALLEMRSCKKCLMSLRKLKVLKHTEVDWIVKHWIPQLERLDLKRLGILIPEKTIAKNSIIPIITALKATKIETIYFTKLENALQNM